MKKNRIAILGAGNLGIAIAKGTVKKRIVSVDEITLTKRDTKGLSELSDMGYMVTSNNSKAVMDAQIIFLCVQPNQLPKLIEEIKEGLTHDHVLVSVITGVSITQLQALIQVQVPIIRAMPNTAIAIGESMTCIAADEHSKAFLPKIEQLFGAVGKTLVIEEELMQAATVLGASGIAFFMRYLRAATQGGVQMGFDSSDAQLIATQTARGAASLILELGTHPEVEIDKVTTPQGCTIEGLNEMEHKGFSSALIRGIMTSFNRISTMKSSKPTRS